VRVVRRRRAAAVLIVSAGLSLGACGTGSVSHAVRPTTSSSTTSTTPRSLNARILIQIGSELGTLNNALKQANADLNHPKPDS